MPRRRSEPSAQLVAIGEHAAAVIIAEMDAAGLPLDWQVYGPLIAPMGIIATALERESLARRTAKIATLDEQRATWAAEAGAVQWEALQALWGLSQAEMHAASDLGVLQEIMVPWTMRQGFTMLPRYYRAVALTEEQHAQIASKTLLSRTDAAERLGITPAAFDKLRKAHGIERADTVPTRAGNMLFLYRQTDVDRLAPTVAGTSRRAPAAPENRHDGE